MKRKMTRLAFAAKWVPRGSALSKVLSAMVPKPAALCCKKARREEVASRSVGKGERFMAGTRIHPN